MHANGANTSCIPIALSQSTYLTTCFSNIANCTTIVNFWLITTFGIVQCCVGFFNWTSGNSVKFTGDNNTTSMRRLIVAFNTDELIFGGIDIAKDPLFDSLSPVIGVEWPWARIMFKTLSIKNNNKYMRKIDRNLWIVD